MGLRMSRIDRPIRPRRFRKLSKVPCYSCGGNFMPFLRGHVFRLFTFLWILCAASSLVAQSGTNSGTLNGTVMDGSGAVVPGAQVVIQNPVSGYSRTVISDDSGKYQFPNLPFNSYH